MSSITLALTPEECPSNPLTRERITTMGPAKAFTVCGKVITKEHCKIYEGLVEFESGDTMRAKIGRAHV